MMNQRSKQKSTFKTLTSFRSCFITCSSTLSVPDTTIVKRALSLFKPTARDSILYPLLAKTPAIRFIIPLSSPTNTEIVWRLTLNNSNMTSNYIPHNSIKHGNYTAKSVKTQKLGYFPIPKSESIFDIFSFK